MSAMMLKLVRKDFMPPFLDCPIAQNNPPRTSRPLFARLVGVGVLVAGGAMGSQITTGPHDQHAGRLKENAIDFAADLPGMRRNLQAGYLEAATVWQDTKLSWLVAKTGLWIMELSYHRRA